MQSQGKIKVKGRVSWELFSQLGVLLAEGEGENLVVNDGEVILAKLLAGESVTAPSHMAIGSGSSAAAAGDTALGSELGRVALTSKTRTGNSVAFLASFPAGTGTGTVAEAGVLNAASGGDLFSRFLTGTITKGANDILAITWTLTFEGA